MVLVHELSLLGVGECSIMPSTGLNGGHCCGLPQWQKLLMTCGAAAGVHVDVWMDHWRELCWESAASLGPLRSSEKKLPKCTEQAAEDGYANFCVTDTNSPCPSLFLAVSRSLSYASLPRKPFLASILFFFFLFLLHHVAAVFNWGNFLLS